VLASIFLVACVLATLTIAGILFVLFGPVPVKRSVAIVPRLSAPVSTTPMPNLVAQLAPRDGSFAPTFESTFPSTIHGAPPVVPAVVPARPMPRKSAPPEPPPLPMAETISPVSRTSPQSSSRKPKHQKVQPMPRKRAAKGTEAPSPFAPVVRHRQFREEDVATNPVRMFETEELTMVDDN